jgi:hypothetical protein
LNPVTSAFWPASFDGTMVNTHQTVVDAASIHTDLDSAAEVFPRPVLPSLSFKFFKAADLFEILICYLTSSSLRVLISNLSTSNFCTACCLKKNYFTPLCLCNLNYLAVGVWGM